MQRVPELQWESLVQLSRQRSPLQPRKTPQPRWSPLRQLPARQRPASVSLLPEQLAAWQTVPSA
jgi:hypothetical protein